MSAGTIAVSLHATLQNVSQISNENVDKINSRVNGDDRNIQLTNLTVKNVSKNMDNILTVTQQPTSTTNYSAAESESQTAMRNTKAKSTSSSSSKKRARNESPELMRCKRRINFTQLGYNIPQAPPTSVARRNERERNRVKLVNLGFATLREHVPNGSKNKKMSKVDTLRSAVEYIRKLQQLLNDEDDDDDEDEEEEEHGGVRESTSGNSLKSDGGSCAGSSDIGSPYRDSTVDSPQVFAENLPPTHHHYHHHHHHHSMNPIEHSNSYPSRNPNCPPASVSPICSVSSSPSPSQTSDYSSYEPLSPEEEDLLDFTSWFT